jgi:hypothetical protein
VDGEVVIDLFVEVVAGLEKLHHFKVVLVWIDYLIVDHSRIVQQNFIVILTQTQTHHLGVSLDIVELINIDRIPLIIDYIEHPESFPPPTSLPFNQVTYKSDIFLRQVYCVLLVGVGLASVDHVFEEAGGGPLVRPVGVGVDVPQKVVVEDVRERPVAQVVAQPRDRHVVHVPLVYLQLRLLTLQLQHQLLRYISRTYTVLEAVVHGCREYVIYTPKLLQVAESLKLLCVDYVPAKKSQ